MVLHKCELLGDMDFIKDLEELMFFWSRGMCRQMDIHECVVCVDVVKW